MQYNIIHVTGASGSGTTTLAKAICARYGHTHLDTDNFFWEPIDPPFTTKRPIDCRQKLLMDAVLSADKCVISGSLAGWGDIFIPMFDLVVYLSTPTPVRLERLRERERQSFGARILPDGDMYGDYLEFLDWAARYDTGGEEIRSAQMHRNWLKKISCPVIRLEGIRNVEDNINMIRQSTRG